MADLFVTFQRFAQLQDASETLRVLERNDIPYEVEQVSHMMDSIFTFNRLGNRIIVKVPQSRFLEAREQIENICEIYFTGVPEGHPLLQSTVEELEEVMVSADEWSPMDVVIARHLLRQQGMETEPEVWANRRKQRLSSMRKPQQIQSHWKRLGYLGILFAGIPTMLIGAAFAFTRKVDPEGKLYYVYDEEARKLGFFLFLLGGATLGILGLSYVWMSLGKL
ncbi:hypothetical protein [Pontibacter sp. G13]|uniref:hypothetical protein n=1 Tax=Pontibacter sp. G13 TaxID=3074898 RepID=UPI00288932F6|nr:hypothetical protein [Pontibacter sp. G13]WNJ17029.1 hypothetical protein RJD25_19415 [Pontibacter sp. G13]